MKPFKPFVALVVLSASLFAADFSKHSLTELQNLAGKVKPADALDYKIEIRKRIESMSVKDARAFMQTIQQNSKAVRDKMTLEEWNHYQAAVREANQARIDSMSVKEARELGVLKKSHLHPKACKKGNVRDLPATKQAL